MLRATRIMALAVGMQLISFPSAYAQRVAISSNDGDAHGSSLLDRPANLSLHRVPLGTALRSLAERSGVVIAFSASLLPPDRVVSCTCKYATVGTALERLLAGTRLLYRELQEEIAIIPRVVASPSRARYASLERMPIARAAAPIFSHRMFDTAAMRQVGTIAGVVTDATTDQPIRSASVQIEGERLGTMTDTEGRYRLEGVPAGTHTLVASVIGYESQAQTVEVTTGELATVDFALTVSALRLDEVVVTATGDRRRMEVANVVGSVDVEDLTRTAPITNMASLLNARSPGVQVLGSTGNVGVASRIRIRGLNSMSLNNDPIVYVDGMRVAGSMGAFAGGAGIYATGWNSARIDDINPNAIESLDVLKGPAAAALYGTDAANGVIVIRTKRGVAGPPRWTISLENGIIDQPAEFPAAYHAWGRRTDNNASTQCVLTAAVAGACVQDSISSLNLLADPHSTPFATGHRRQAGVQVSGGTEAARYFVSANFTDELGTLRMPTDERERLEAERGEEIPSIQLRPNSLQRMNLRGNLSTSLAPTAQLDLSVGYIASDHLSPTSDGSGVYGLMRNALQGRGYRDALGGWWQFQGGDIMALEQTDDLDRFVGSLATDWRPLSWLETRATAGLDRSNREIVFFQRRGQGVPFSNFREGRRLESRHSLTNYTVDLGATGTFAVSPRFRLRTASGLQYFHTLANQVNATGSVLAPGGQTVNSGAVRDAAQTTAESVTLGAFLEQTASFNDRLFLTGSVRTDQNSAFGSEFEAVFYPRASFSWLISEEDFFPRIQGVDALRYRIAYGTSGVSPGPLDALQYYTPFSNIEETQERPGLEFRAIGNPDLKPERTTEFETGIDLDLFSQRVNLEVTYYRKLSRDALVERPLAPSLGLRASNRFENLGSVRNQGLEGTLDVQLLRTAALTWDLAVSGSINSNELIELGEGITVPVNPYARARAVPGYPLWGRWDRPILGFDDADGNGIIEPAEVEVGPEPVYLGSPLPTREASFTSSVTVLNGLLRLRGLVDYRGGFVRLNRTEADRCVEVDNCRAVNDPLAPLWEQARAVAVSAPALGQTFAGYIEDGSYAKLRELSLSLDVPDRYARILGSRGATITLAGRNLHTWTDYSGIDPESAMPFGEPSNYDLNVVPITRLWTLRITVDY